MISEMNGDMKYVCLLWQIMPQRNLIESNSLVESVPVLQKTVEEYGGMKSFVRVSHPQKASQVNIGICAGRKLFVQIQVTTTQRNLMRKRLRSYARTLTNNVVGFDFYILKHETIRMPIYENQKNIQ